MWQAVTQYGLTAIATWVIHTAWLGAIIVIPAVLLTKAISNWSPRWQDRISTILLLAIVLLPLATAIQGGRVTDGDETALGSITSGDLQIGDRLSTSESNSRSGLQDPVQIPNGTDTGNAPGEPPRSERENTSKLGTFRTGVLALRSSTIPSMLASAVSSLAAVANSCASWLKPFFPLLTLGWLLGVAAGTARLISGHRSVVRLIRSADDAGSEVARCVENVRRQQGLRHPIRTRISPHTEVPMVVGLFSPSLLLPESASVDESLVAILHHEVAHLKRKDPLRSAVLLFAELFFFHVPVVWFLSRRLRVLREYCCDAVALKYTGDAIAYARALTDLESHRSGRGAWVFAINGTSLESRVRWMLSDKPRESRLRRIASAGVACGAVFTLALAAWSAPDLTGGPNPNPGATAAEGAILPTDVRAAYDVDGWTRTDFFREIDLALEAKDDLRAIDLFWLAGQSPPGTPQSDRNDLKRMFRLSEAADRRRNSFMPVPGNLTELCPPFFRGITSARTDSGEGKGLVTRPEPESGKLGETGESPGSSQGTILSFHFDSQLGSEIVFDGVELEIAADLHFSRTDGPHGRQSQWLFHDPDVDANVAPYLLFYRDGPRYLYIWDADRDGEADWVRSYFVDYKAPPPGNDAREDGDFSQTSDSGEHLPGQPGPDWDTPGQPVPNRAGPSPDIPLAARKNSPQGIRATYETQGWTWDDFQAAIDDAVESQDDVGTIDYAWLAGRPPRLEDFSEEWLERMFSLGEAIYRRYDEAFLPPANIETLYPFGWNEDFNGTSFGGRSGTDSTTAYFAPPGSAENAQVQIRDEPYLLTVDFDLDGRIDLRFDGIEAEVDPSLRYLHETGPFGRRSQWLISKWNAEPRENPFFFLYRDGPSWMFLLASDREGVRGCGGNDFVSNTELQEASEME